MVNRILRIFHKEIAGLHQAAFLLGAFTFLSQLLALVRDRMLAGYFGAGQTLDVYYTAFRIPDLIYASVASLVSISVLIPFLTGVMEQDKEKSSDPASEKIQSKKILNSVFTVFFIAMVLVSVLAFALMPILVHTFFSNIGDETVLSKIIFLSRLLLLQPICLGISNVLGVVTQIGKRFFLYALSPIFYNIAIIVGLVFLYPRYGITGVVLGVVFGGLLHFAIQIPYVLRVGLLPKFTFKVDFKIILNVVKVSIPRTIALSANMFELIVITSFASWLAVGSVAVFNLALNLQSVPFAIIGVSYALAAFPTLSAYFAKGEREQFMSHIITATRHVIFWSIPIAALFIVLRAQIVRTILGNGYFNWDHTKLTAACLALFVISLVAQGLELLFIRAYYAAGNTIKPVIINIFSSAATILAPLLLLKLYASYELFRFFIESLFKVQDIAGASVLMLPLGYSIGTLLNALAFWIMFERDFGKNKGTKVEVISSESGEVESTKVTDFGFTSSVLPTLFASLQAAVVGGFMAYVGLNVFDGIFNLSTVTGIFMQGFLAGILGIIGAISVFILLENSELKEVSKTLQQKFTRGKIIVSEPDKIEV